MCDVPNRSLRKQAMVVWAVAAFASTLAIQPGYAETSRFHCGKAFVTFQSKEVGRVEVITVRKKAITHIAYVALPQGEGGLPGLMVRQVWVRQPDGELTVFYIDEATHNQLIECLD